MGRSGYDYSCDGWDRMTLAARIADAARIVRSTQAIAEKVYGDSIITRALGLQAEAFEKLVPEIAQLELAASHAHGAAKSAEQQKGENGG